MHLFQNSGVKNKNDNEQSDSSYVIYSHTIKNPDDEGEGLENINDNKVEANEQQLKHRNSIKVQQNPETFAEKCYLCVMTRRSRKSIREVRVQENWVCVRRLGDCSVPQCILPGRGVPQARRCSRCGRTRNG